MVSAFILLSAALIQTIAGQCLGPFGPGVPVAGVPAVVAAEAALAYGPVAPGLPGPVGPCGPFLTGIPSSSGGGFMITSSSPIVPNGVFVQTDAMAIEGPLLVTGQLPFLGVVALEGPLPVIGQGVVSYGCGDGNVAILNEVGPAPVGPMYPYGPDMGPCGPGYGYNGFPNAYGPYGPFY